MSSVQRVTRGKEPTDNSKVILEAQDLGKTYVLRAAEPVIALEKATFKINEGEFVALVGPSGCGKSTLLNLVGGLILASKGVLRFRDDVITRPRPEVGMMFQQPVLFPWRTTIENVLLSVDVRKQRRKDHLDRARKLISSVGLANFENSYPAELSGGMQQRVALCRLLLQDPEVMLLDEPFGALDEFTREAMNLELLDIWRGSGKTALLVTHNISEAVFLADRVFVMTPQPGKLSSIVEVDLPRPREIAMMKTSRFVDLTFRVRELLDQDREEMRLADS